jgi:hypothetical protein
MKKEILSKKNFTCIGKSVAAAATPATREDWEKMRRDPELKALCTRIENGEEELKGSLPVWTPHCSEFKNNHRSTADAVQPLHRLMLDFDEKGHTQEIMERLQSSSPLEVLLIEESARRGTHVLVSVPEGMTPDEVQQLMAKATGYEPDKAVKDVARCIYMVPEDHTRFVSEKLFDCTACATEATTGATESGNHGTVESIDSEIRESKSAKTFNGVPYQDIISEWWRQHGGEPKEGVRNIALHKLAVHLRGICDNRQDVLLEVMPRLGLSDAELRSIIASACKEQPKGLTLEMKAVLKALDVKYQETTVSPQTSPSTPPEMPKKLPKLIKLLTSKTPDIYKPTVAQAVFPALATHLCQVKFEYIDGVMHQATLMNVVMAETGAGKSCIDKPIQAIMADIAARDKANLAREKAWKDEVNSKGANKDKAKRPEGLVIQQIDADMTNAAFVMRLEESEGHFLFLKINEIQQLDALKGNGKAGQQFQIICLAFDPDSEYGQTRVGTQSISARVQVLFNFNACTTVNKGRQYFRNVLVDGPISRINFCTIPEQPIGSPIPKYGKYDAQFSEELKPFIDNLCVARGEIFCPEAYRLAKKLDDELKQKAIESQNRTFENLSFRANVIAYLKACVLYVANGCKWEKSIEDFIRWSLNYDLWCKMEFFGDAITQANRFNGPSNNQPKSLLEDLPKVFTREDVKTLYIKKGMDTSKVAQTIRMWKHRNLIIEQADGTYKQLRYAA